MPSLDDLNNFQNGLENELAKLDRHHEADQGPIKRWIQRLDGHVATSTMQLYLRTVRTVSELLGEDVALVELTEADMDEFSYDAVHELGKAGETVRNYQASTRRFLKFVHDEPTHWAHEYPLRPADDDPVTPDDMLKDEDIAALRSASNHHRNVAFIEFLADTGARLTLGLSLRVGDVDVDGEPATYTPNPNAQGLKGAPVREYPLIDAAATIRTYLDTTHPRPDDPDVALFHKVRQFGPDDDGGIKPSTMREHLKDAADRAGIDKPVNPHNFRHSAITRMRREGYTRSEVEHRVHWKIDTDMWARYEHISGEEHNRAIWQKAGIVDEDPDGPSQQRLRCGNCLEPHAPHHHRCPRCGAPISKAARDGKVQAVDESTEISLETSDGEIRIAAGELAKAINHDLVGPALEETEADGDADADVAGHGESPSEASSD